MRNPIFSRRRAERFAQLLDEANGGRRHHVRSRDDHELSELVAVAHQARDAHHPVQVDADFRAGLRAMLVATAGREGIGVTANVDPAAPDGSGASPGSWTRGLLRPALDLRPALNLGPVLRLLPALNARRARARGAIVVGIAAGAVALSGMSAASENAVPGDALYGMKRSTERAQLALASSDLSRGQLFLAFARTRLAEARAVRGDTADLSSVLDDMDADTRHGVKLLTTSSVRLRDASALDAIGTFVTRQRHQVGGLLDGTSRAVRERALASLTLLDSVRKRADGLHAALDCDARPPARADALGPVPSGCSDQGSRTQGDRAGGSADAGEPYGGKPTG